MRLSGVKGLAGLVLAAGIAATAPQLARAETLTDTLIAAYRNSNLLEQNRAVLRAADEDAAQALAGLRPVLNFIARGSWRSGVGIDGAETPENPDLAPPQSVNATFELAAEVTLLDFGRGQLGIDAARENVLATRATLRNVEQQVLLQAVQAFMDVRSAAQTVGLRRNNLELIRQELQAARDRFEVGEITRTDVAIAEARLAAARSNLAAAEGDLDVARESFNAAVGRYPGDLRNPARRPETASSLEAAQNVARRNHPAIIEARHQVAASELNVEIARLARQGSVNAGANLSTALPGDDAELSASLSYSRPIYRGGQLSSTYRQAVARRDSARAALHQTVAEVLQQVGAAWSGVRVAQARLAASDQQISAAQTAYEGVSEEATLGARTTLDVLDAEQELLDARTTRISAEAALQTATYRLLQAMGLLTVDHLDLGIPTYDPEAYYEAVRDAPATSIQGERLDRVLESIGRQ
ncbi:transporter [Rhodobacteraceae bacterium WD3A24]|nr:transporter [Rhodobacteraceae bacterium WD3A24]